VRALSAKRKRQIAVTQRASLEGETYYRREFDFRGWPAPSARRRRKKRREREREGGKKKRKRKWRPALSERRLWRTLAPPPPASAFFSTPFSTLLTIFAASPCTQTRFRVRLLRQRESLIRIIPLSLVTPLNEGPTVCFSMKEACVAAAVSR